MESVDDVAEDDVVDWASAGTRVAANTSRMVIIILERGL